MALDTNIARVRLLIMDNDVNYRVFSDEEINFFLEENQENIYLASAQALEVNAVDKARLAKRKQVDGVSEDNTSIPEKLLLLADRYRERATEKTPCEIFSDNLLTSGELSNILLNLGELS